MPDDTESRLEGQITALGTAIALLAKALLSPGEYAEFRAQLEELTLGAAEKTSPLRQHTTIPHGDNYSFLLGISERTEHLLDMLAALTDES